MTRTRVCLGAMLLACGGPQEQPTTGGTQTSDTTATSATTTPSQAASTAPAPSASASSGRPFAATHEDATHMVNDAISDSTPAIAKCVFEARQRKNDMHAEITFDVGVDQEGILIGVKAPKGQKADPPLYECVRLALKDAPFPRSHAGVLTVTKVYSDKVIQK